MKQPTRQRVTIISNKSLYSKIEPLRRMLSYEGYIAQPFYDHNDFRSKANVEKHYEIFRNLMKNTEILYVIKDRRDLDYYVQDDVAYAESIGIPIVYTKEPVKYDVVAMCGPRKFYYEMFMEGLRLKKLNKIVLMPQAFVYQEKDLESVDFTAINPISGLSKLDQLYQVQRQMIDMCDWLYVIDVGGYYGDDTKENIEYAKLHGKKIKYFSKQTKTFLTEIEDEDNRK